MGAKRLIQSLVDEFGMSDPGHLSRCDDCAAKYWPVGNNFEDERVQLCNVLTKPDQSGATATRLGWSENR